CCGYNLRCASGHGGTDYLKPRDPGVQSDAEAFAAAAFALDVRIAEAEGLVQALLDEIDLGAVDQLEVLGGHEYLHVPVLEDDVVAADIVCIVNDISPARASCALHAQANARAPATPCQVILDPLGGRFRQGYRHVRPVLLFISRPHREPVNRSAYRVLSLRDTGAEGVFDDQQAAELVGRRLEKRRDAQRVEPFHVPGRATFRLLGDPRGGGDHVRAAVGAE